MEDPLEAANDAPIIRMLNALLTQAAKATARATSTSNLRALFQRALPR